MVSSSEEKVSTAQPITRFQDLPAARLAVWKIISTPGILTECHPFCRENKVENWPGSGSKDQIVYYSGLKLEREFIDWMEGSGYDLIATTDVGLRYKVSWRLDEITEQTSRLTLTITPYSVERMEQYGRLLGKYLEQVLQGFEFYVRTGRPVTRNQFGSHRLFSPPVNA